VGDFLPIRLNKYKGDKKFVRVHKRIREENNKIEKENKKKPVIISTYDDEIFNFLKSLKEKIDIKIYDRASILKNDAYFGKAVMADLMNNFREYEGKRFETADPSPNITKENYKMYGDDSDRIFIRDRIVKEYLNQYNEIHSI
jgi:type I restriction enzyme R subunit